MIHKVALWRVVVQLLGFVLAMLGLAIVVFPSIVPPLFARRGLPETDDVYARALGLRDLAVGLWFVLGARRSVMLSSLFLTTSALIPLGDLLLVLFGGGGMSLALLPHAASFLVLLVLAAWGGLLARTTP